MLILTTAFFLLGTVQAASQPQTQKQEGIAYVSWWSSQYAHSDADLALANLADTGASWISLLVTQYQDNISSTVIYSTTGTPTDDALIHAITQAHSLGLQVMLKPHVDLTSDPTHWRGQIGQGFTETEWNAWFASYQSVINHYAQLAETYGADQFCVGTELSASQGRATDWRAVIAGVRGYYSGPLTYAANGGSETDITWWDAVDYIGVDAYYRLTDKSDPTVAELKTAWQPYVSTLESLAFAWNRPVLFTEIGYRSQDGANQHPWDWRIAGAIDLEEQADAYQAAFESVFNQPWFVGMYWWAWDTDPFQGGPCEDGYTPHDKPAEDVLRSWYGAPPRTSSPTPQPDYSRTLNVYTDALGPGWGNWSWDVDADLSSDSPVYSGTQAISVTAQAWGALSLHHADIDSTPYYWLEFYVRTSSAEQWFEASVHDEYGAELRCRPLDDCRYTDDQPIQPGAWTRVRIPLNHLDAAERSLQRVSIKNHSSQPSQFWIDEIRLVAASWNIYLPTTIRGGQWSLQNQAAKTRPPWRETLSDAMDGAVGNDR